MSFPTCRPPVVIAAALTAIALFLKAPTAGAQLVPPPEGAANQAGSNRANWALAARFGGDAMDQLTFSSSVQERWIGETDSLFYSWRDRTGLTFYLIDAAARRKAPLFDHVKLAAQLSTLHKRAYDPKMLPFTQVNITTDHRNLRFNVDSTRYNWSIAGEMLTSLGLYRGDQDSALVADEQEGGVGGGGGRGGGRGGGGRGGDDDDEDEEDFQNWSPDSTAFAFARNYNLYVYETSSGDTLQITTEGEDDYSFGGGGGRGGNDDDDDDDDDAPRNVRANVTWSEDSRAFYIQRSDTRKVKELYLVNVLSEPRPTLQSYSYAMPGEEEVTQREVWTYTRGERVAEKAPISKWQDERFLEIHWPSDSGSRLRIIRRDRLQRNLELVDLNVGSGEVRVLITESAQDGSLLHEEPEYIRDGGDFIWFSERTGWGHYYLYSHDGTLRRPVTSGAWRADELVEVDSTRGVAWIAGVGREAGEQAYNEHLYRVNLADASITLLNAGPYDHSADLSPNNKYFIDVYSRPDTMPRVALRDANTGRLVLDLETTDMSRLMEAGWQYPTPFVTKAADGVTNIYGNLWKPFDFDSTKKYPIIAHVYPGPQQESVTSSFSSGGTRVQLAQLGFIVIQIGNRGGTPLRSSAYQNHSYHNLRDYALADKKSGIEQLAARHPWIDIDRVGIFGHSGGGYVTGAALLLPPYNEFFKVGVSSAGNHDNNIYNQNWSEQYHGLMWVAASDTARLTREFRARGRVGGAVADAGGGRGGRGGGGRGGGGRGAGGRGGRGGGQGAADPEAAPPDSVFWIYVPTNVDLAENLKGKLLLVHGDVDNNVHPGNTIRLANALIQANKRFDFMLMPGKQHGFSDYQPYFTQMLMEYFAQHLLGDYYGASADMDGKQN